MRHSSSGLLGLLMGSFLTLFYTNCSHPDAFQENLQTSDSTSMASSADSDSSNLKLASLWGYQIPSGMIQTEKLKVFVSNSMNGPWTENGVACKGRDLFFKLEGLDLSKSTVKGCASPSSSNSCLDLLKHRNYLASEIFGNNIITSLKAQDSVSWPDGNYDFFISRSKNEYSLEIVKVGTSEFKSCSTSAGSPTTAPAVSKICQWNLLNPRFVVGGGPAAFPPTMACTSENMGQEAFGLYKVYTSDVGSPSDFRYRCQCQ